MAFSIHFTERGLETRDNNIDYILYKFRDVFAAERLHRDIASTLKILERGADTYNFCKDKKLQKAGIRKIHLRKYNYKIFYHILNNSEVWVDAILHDSRDFESILKQQFD